jgi:hypothetical protein
MTLIVLSFNIYAAYQYNVKGNQGWLTFDSNTTLSFEVSTTGKDNDHENYIDRGVGIKDYGWYNLNTGESGSFSNGLTKEFSSDNKIGLYITDNNDNTYLSTKPSSPFENDIWGKSKLVDGNLIVGGGNLGSNGTHEYYVFKVSSIPNKDSSPTGQPLPGIIGTLIVGGVGIFYLKNRKRLLSR